MVSSIVVNSFLCSCVHFSRALIFFSKVFQKGAKLTIANTLFQRPVSQNFSRPYRNKLERFSTAVTFTVVKYLRARLGVYHWAESREAHALRAENRLGCKWWTFTLYTLAYYGAELITAAKSFMIEAPDWTTKLQQKQQQQTRPGPNVIKKFTAVIYEFSK